MERTAALAMSAADAGVGVDGQLLVVDLCHLVPGKGQIIVFVDQAHIQSHGAGLTVIAIDADPGGVLRGKFPDHRS